MFFLLAMAITTTATTTTASRARSRASPAPSPTSSALPTERRRHESDSAILANTTRKPSTTQNAALLVLPLSRAVPPTTLWRG
ncbi:hypothetical protein K438DRAFT_1867472 [Mycena galopus ATCC 62051]|nr:hypothetical protein K438DRAFT_1867472 [Mycena galopus ATCC 62051]